MQQITFYVQYHTESSIVINKLPNGAVVQPYAYMLSYPGNPDVDGDKHVMYAKYGSENDNNNNNKYIKRVTEFPFKKVTGKIFRTMPEGQCVVISHKDAAQFSYRRGPTVWCNMLVLLNNGYTLPLLEDQLIELNHKMFLSDYEKGCNLRWKSVDAVEGIVKIDKIEKIEQDEKSEGGEKVEEIELDHNAPITVFI